MNSKLIIKTSSILIIFFMSCLSVFSQVTIGYDEIPEEGAILQLKNKTNTIDGGVNADKGFLLPRVELEALNILTVMANPTNADKLNHRGTLVYNMTVDQSKDLKEGIYKWDGAKWDYIGSGEYEEGNAIFTIEDCSSDIIVRGTYGSGVALTAGNIVSVKVKVTKKGAYTLNASVTSPSNDNGYFFSSSGVFMGVGEYIVNMAGMGTPVKFGTDNFTLFINGVANNGEGVSPCTFDVNVDDTTIRPRYSLNCSSTKIRGRYYEDAALTADNYIEVTINVESSSAGANYHLWTNEVDGIKFEGSGTLSGASTQTVKLYGSGIALGNNDKKFYIQSNSESSTATCIATIIVIIPPKKILSIGRHTVYGYCLGAASTVSNAMIVDTLNFGPTANSIVRYAGFKNAGTAHASNVIPFNLANQKAGRSIYAREGGYFNIPSNGEERLRLYLEGTTENGEQVTPVDILYIGWTGVHTEAGDWTPSAAQMALIKTFLENGGIVMVNNENINFNRAFLRGIFDDPNITMTSGGANNPPGSVYQLASIPTDPILNGPFGNISGLYWGEDASTTVYATDLPMEEVLLYSSNKNLCKSTSVAVQGAATLFRHRTLPLIWSGDGGFTAGLNADASPTIIPFKTASKTISGVTYKNYPVCKPKYGCVLPYYPVFNAIFTANALAWCIKTSDEIRRQGRP